MKADGSMSTSTYKILTRGEGGRSPTPDLLPSCRPRRRAQAPARTPLHMHTGCVIMTSQRPISPPSSPVETARAPALSART